MVNLRSVRVMNGYTVRATDGNIGRARELYFDDSNWRIKYIVVDINRLRPGRKVLLPSSVVDQVKWERREIWISATMEAVRNSPDIATDKPVALQRIAEKRGRRNWAMYLAGEAVIAAPEILNTPDFVPVNKNGKPFDPHLRTTRVVMGLALRASDGSAGHIVDFIVDDESWVIRYLVIELGDRRRVLLFPGMVKEIRIEEFAARIDIPARVIADCPTLDPSTLVTRRYEESVAGHYQVSGYWAS